MRVKNSSGWILMEGLVSFFVLILVTGILLLLLPSTRNGMNLSTHRLHAAFLAKTLLEEARSRSFSEVKPFSGAENMEFIHNGVKQNIRFSYRFEVETKDIDKKDLWGVVSWKETDKLKEIIVETVLVDPEAVQLP